MNFMANNIYNGAVVTITDSNGTPFQYQMIDKVDVDVYGEVVLQSIGRRQLMFICTVQTPNQFSFNFAIQATTSCLSGME